MRLLKPILASALLSLCFTVHATGLKLGSPAPDLKVAKWVKGTPVAKLGEGKINVVEFWATWCGPCKVSIPHLTELAKKYKDRVTFTGVSVWEARGGPWDPKTFEKVEQFVKEYGDKMNYNVAADGPEGTMAETWMTAANQKGIPSAFIVGKEGNILWIGHPMGGLDEALEQILNGTYDLAAAQAKVAKEEAAAAEEARLMKPLQDAVRAKDLPAALAALANIEKADAKYVKWAAMQRFNLFRRLDQTKLYAYAAEAGRGVLKDDVQALNSMAWTIAEGKGLTDPDYRVAVGLAQRAAELTKSKDPMILDTLGYSQFKAGDLEKAIATQKIAVGLLKDNADIPEDVKKEIRDRLAEFEAKRG